MEILVFIRKHLVRFFLFGSVFIVFAQTSETDSWYQKLDVFLENPTPESSLKLEKQLESLQATSKTAKLAKVIIYTNLGFYAQQYNNLNRTIYFYEEAKNIFFENSLSNYNIVEYCLKPLGNLYTKTNSFSEAENTIKQYLLIAENQKNKKLETAALLNLSVVYKSVGNYDKAILLLNQALVYQPNNTKIQLQIIENYVLKNNFTTAETLLKPLQQKHPNNSKIYDLDAQIAFKKNNFEIAENLLKKALFIQQNKEAVSPRNLAKTHLRLSQVQYKQNKLDKAENAINEIFKLLIPAYKKQQKSPEISQLYAENTLLDALDLQAAISKHQNKLELAFNYYQKANYVSQLLFKLTPLRQSKITQQTHRKNRFENLLTILHTLYKKSNNKRWLQEALAVDAQSKSFIVNENKQLQILLNTHSKDSLVKKYFQINSELEQTNTTLLSLALHNDTNIEKIYQVQNNYSNLVSQQRSVFNKIKEKYPITDLYANEFSLQKLEKKLQRSNQTIVSYFFGAKSVFQFQLSKESLVFNKLVSTQQRNSLFNLCVELNGFYENASEINNNPQGYINLAYQLYSVLNIPSVKELVIIPDGIMSFVPFDALVSRSMKFTNYEEVPFLLLQSKLSYHLSLSNYLSSTDVSNKEESSVFGVFPKFKNTKKELQFSSIEAEAIQKNFKSKLVFGKDATSQQFLNNLTSFDVVHLSTHARGGTFTSPPVIEFSNEELSVQSIYGYNLQTKLIVLSACETGVGSLVKGEGVINLARGFSYSGANNIIFSLWNVNDFSTAWLMKSFYDNLSKNKTTVNALTIAKRNYLMSDEISNTKKSPFYWASFVYYGDAITLQSSSTNSWIWMILILLIGGGLFGFLFRKKNHILNF